MFKNLKDTKNDWKIIFLRRIENECKMASVICRLVLKVLKVLDIVNINIKIILSLFRVYRKLKNHLKKVLQMKLEDVFCIYKLNYMYFSRDQTCYTVHRFAQQCIWFMILVTVGFAQDNSSVLTGVPSGLVTAQLWW